MTKKIAKGKEESALIPETILKKRHDLEELARKRKAAAVSQKRSTNNNKQGKKKIYVKKPETFLARARNRINNERRFKRVMQKGMQKRASNKKETRIKEIRESDNATQNAGEGVVVTNLEYQTNSVGASLVFCVRIRDSVGAPRSVTRALTMIRLNQVHEGVFLRYDERTRKLLHLVEPWVVYGRPTKAIVEDLIERRGHGRVAGERVPLSDNMIIEHALGDKNIICTEDLVHEIFSVGSSFDVANQFLWPFRLVDSKTEFERRMLRLKDGKEYGDRGDAINEYIQAVI